MLDLEILSMNISSVDTSEKVKKTLAAETKSGKVYGCKSTKIRILEAV